MEESRHELDAHLRELTEYIKSTSLAFPNRASLLGLVTAAVVLVVDPSSKVGRNEFRLHVQDALKPLGLVITRVNRKPRRRQYSRRGRHSQEM